MRQATPSGLAALARRMAATWPGHRLRPQSTRAGVDPGLKRRLETLDARMDRMETALEGLQDAVYRQAIRQDESLADLRKRTEPERIARALSADARRRGL
jgi:ABC-type phosphate transport system auxiliary subunit